MFKHRRLKQKAAFFQIYKNRLVRVFTKCTGPVRFFGHFAFCVYQLNKGQIVIASYICVILTKSGGDVYHAGTIGQCYIAVTGYIPTFFIRFYKVKKRLIFFIFQIFAHKVFQNFRLTLEHSIYQRLSHIIRFSFIFHFNVAFFWMNTQSHIRRKCPRSGSPSQEISVFPFYFKADNGRALFDIFISLRYFMAGQRRSTAGTIGDNFKAFVQKSFFPNLL